MPAANSESAQGGLTYLRARAFLNVAGRKEIAIVFSFMAGA